MTRSWIAARRSLTSLVAVMLLGVATAQAAGPRDSTALVARPDARVKVQGAAALVGNDVYGAATQQTVRGFVRYGGSITYVLSMQNDGDRGDRFRVRAGGTSAAFTVTYRTPSGQDVTSAVAAGTFTTPVLAPGAAYRLTAALRPTGSDDQQRRTATLTSVARPTVSDTVAFITRTNMLTSTASVAYWRLPTTAKVVALTLDAGSDLGYTNMVLDTLAAKGVQASFGITGEFAQDHPDQVRRMAREGHVVMNHSLTHASFTGASSDEVLLTRAERQADVRAADAILRPLVGSSTIPYWRPPFGDQDASVRADIGAIGYSATVMWTFDSLGWQGLTAEQILVRVMTEVEPGAIIVMHVGSQSQDGPALATVIDGLRYLGYSFTTVFNGIPH